MVVLVDVLSGPPRLIDERQFYIFDALPADVMPLTKTYSVARSARADETSLDAADADLQIRLQSAGWFRARVAHDLVRVDAQTGSPRVWLRVRIDSGSRTVARFEGNEHYDDEALSGALGLDSETDRAIPLFAISYDPSTSNAVSWTPRCTPCPRARYRSHRGDRFPHCGTLPGASRGETLSLFVRRYDTWIVKRRSAFARRHRQGDRQLSGRRICPGPISWSIPIRSE